MKSRCVRANRAGFSLLATLWLVVAIGVVGLEWGLRARDQRRVAMNVVDAAAARAAAESGLAQARARLEHALRRPRSVDLVDPIRSLDPWGSPQFLVPDTAGRVGEAVGAGQVGAHWRLAIEDAGTTLDLNRTEEEGLRRLMLALRVDADRADRVAQSIADWRDADDSHRPRGAEREWYETAGRAVFPRNGPFQEIAELRHVRGVSEELYDRIAPYLSVRGAGRVNLLAAPRPVLLALPGIGEEAVRALERRRRERRPLPAIASLGDDLSPAARERFAATLPRLTAMTTTETTAVRVTSVGLVDGSSVRVRADALIVRVRSAVYLVWLEVRP